MNLIPLLSKGRLGGVIKRPINLYASKLFNSKAIKEKRRKLRKEATRHELILWKYLRGRQFSNYKFRRQYSIGKFIVDFYCPKIKLAIELDGGSHFFDNNSVKHDFNRQKYIESKGIKMLRFLNTDLDLYPKEVLQTIFQNLP